MSLGEPRIEVLEPGDERCPRAALPPEGNVKLRNYRVLNENLRAYTPTGDVHTSPGKGKLVARWDACAVVSPPRHRILELVRAEHEGRDALEAIVRPAARRGLERPLDDDTRRFLQRALLSPSPYLSETVTPEPRAPPSPGTPEPKVPSSQPDTPEPSSLSSQANTPEHSAPSSQVDTPEPGERSLADELCEADASWSCGEAGRRRRTSTLGLGGAAERERLGRLALSVEQDEGAGSAGLGAAARRLDALLAESRALHRELAAIHHDLQEESARACRCAAAARGLAAESRALRYLDDVVALLRGDEHAAVRARAWPFAFGRRAPARNYIV